MSWKFNWNPDLSGESRIKTEASKILDEKTIKHIERLAVQSKAETLLDLDTEHVIWLQSSVDSVQFYIRIWFDGKYNIVLEEIDAGDLAFIVFDAITCETYETQISSKVLKVDFVDFKDNNDFGISK